MSTRSRRGGQEPRCCTHDLASPTGSEETAGSRAPFSSNSRDAASPERLVEAPRPRDVGGAHVLRSAPDIWVHEVEGFRTRLPLCSIARTLMSDIFEQGDRIARERAARNALPARCEVVLDLARDRLRNLYGQIPELHRRLVERRVNPDVRVVEASMEPGGMFRKPRATETLKGRGWTLCHISHSSSGSAAMYGLVLLEDGTTAEHCGTAATGSDAVKFHGVHSLDRDDPPSFIYPTVVTPLNYSFTFDRGDILADQEIQKRGLQHRPGTALFGNLLAKRVPGDNTLVAERQAAFAYSFSLEFQRQVGELVARHLA